MLRLTELSLPLDHPADALRQAIVRRLGIDDADLLDFSGDPGLADRASPQVRWRPAHWLLIGDDGQHDDEIYTQFASKHPDNVVAVAIRRMSSVEAVLAGGRTAVDDHSAAQVPWVTASDGAGLLERLEEAGVIRP